MRHAVKYKKLNVTSSHRKALLRNMADALILHERIKLTLPKAKVLRPYVEKLVTRARRDSASSLVTRRYLAEKVFAKESVTKLVGDLGKRFMEREGGYLRIVKLGYRKDDAVLMAYIEFVDYVPTPKKVKVQNEEDAVESSGGIVG